MQKTSVAVIGTFILGIVWLMNGYRSPAAPDDALALAHVNPSSSENEASKPKKLSRISLDSVTIERSSPNQHVTLLTVFNQHIDSAQKGVASSQFEIAYITGNCMYANSIASADAITAEWELSEYYHTNGPVAETYQVQLANLEICKQILDQIPSQVPADEWSANMLDQSRKAGYSAALVSMVSESVAVELLLEHPESLQQHHLVRTKAMGALANSDPSFLEDSVRVIAWEATICHLDPLCNLQEAWRSIETQITPVELEQLRTAHAALELRMRAGTAISALKDTDTGSE